MQSRQQISHLPLLPLQSIPAPLGNEAIPAATLLGAVSPKSDAGPGAHFWRAMYIDPAIVKLTNRNTVPSMSPSSPSTSASLSPRNSMKSIADSTTPSSTPPTESPESYGLQLLKAGYTRPTTPIRNRSKQNPNQQSRQSVMTLRSHRHGRQTVFWELSPTGQAQHARTRIRRSKLS